MQANLFADTATMSAPNVYIYEISEEIGPAAWRKTKRAFEEARNMKADYVLLELNTYGGMVDMADSIRTMILESPLRTIVFINNNAASAGALISIACDRIYMRKGASIGAASVVNQEGQVMPEKYQSYMRSLMRSTAETKGRDPKIAEGFVDPELEIPGVKPKGKVLTFTTAEAISHRFCDGQAESIPSVLEQEGIPQATSTKQKVTLIDKIIHFLISPAISGILILLIIAGIYYELQAPGIGFPLAVSILAALLYFAPLYLEGLAANWEILLFISGLILLGAELFIIPGFGVAGVLGIAFVVTGLALSLVMNDYFHFTWVPGSALVNAFLLVFISIVASIVLSVILGKNILKSSLFRKLVLEDEQRSDTGYRISTEFLNLAGKKGQALTVLRPGGKIEIDGEIYDAISEGGFIEKGTNIVVTKHSTSSLVVKPY